MKDRLLGMILSYRKVGDSTSDPLVREELFFQGDSAMTNYASLDDMPFHIISTSGFDAQRSVTENSSPGNVQNRELTVYLRVRDRSVDIHDTLGKYMDAIDTNEQGIHLATEGPSFYVPQGSTGSGIINLNLYMGGGNLSGLKRYECSVSIKSITGDLYVPSNNLYVLTMVMHDHAFLRYEDPFQVEWEIPYVGSFVDANHDPIGEVRHTTTRLPSGITRNRLTRPRITVEATAVSTTKPNIQRVEMLGYYNDPDIVGNPNSYYKNSLTAFVIGRQNVNPTDPYLNPGETTSLILNDPFNPRDRYVSPPGHVPTEHTALYYFNGGYETNHTQRGFDHMNFPIADGATLQINTRAFTETPAPRAGADVKVTFDFFDMLTGVIL